MIAYVDMFSGISGDMFLGALIDLGVPAGWLEQALFGLFGGFELKAQTVSRNHLAATDFNVAVTDPQPQHRHYADIRQMIEKSPFSERVKDQSLQIFACVARAEAGIHGTRMDDVHFHEVGAADSIIDIVGACLALEYLGITDVVASEVPLGSGSVTCSHGEIPVPVPAVLSILEGVPVRQSDAQTEIVTPTGAAIIKTLARQFGPMPEMMIEKTGYGAGNRETGSKLPNLVRVILGREKAKKGDNAKFITQEKIMVVKTGIDDMPPELSGFVMEQLLDNGALDVCFHPVQMKKNRPGVQMEVICFKEQLETVVETLLTQTTSIGVRVMDCDRFVLPRKAITVQTRFGEVAAKKITNPDGTTRIVPEYEKAKQIALATGIPLKDVYDGIVADTRE